jgi:hypothetical protein
MRQETMTMMKTKRMGVVLAMFLVACGGETGEQTQETGRTTDEVQSTVSCDDISQVVEYVRDALGSCTPTFENQEPLAFSHAVCDDQLDVVCGAADEASIQQYLSCLQAVPACTPAQQAAFDDAIDDCLDTFQNSDANYECVELVVGD